MGKLGKKARKFAKKNLQSVLRQRRKNKAFMSKKKFPKNYAEDDVDEQTGISLGNTNGRNIAVQDASNISLDSIFKQDGDLNTYDDVLESDGYLSEVTDSTLSSERENGEGDGGNSALSEQNLKIHEDLIIQKKKLKRLRMKDPEFEKFLLDRLETIQNEDMYSDEDKMHSRRTQLLDEQESMNATLKLFTSSAIDSCCQLVKEKHCKPALIYLLNAYRTACHYGAELSGPRIQSSETFSKILIFILSEVDSVFESLLHIPSLNRKKETVLELVNTSKWQNLEPLVRSYLRSTLFLLSQVTDGYILAFALERLRASLIYFAAFPSLRNRLIKTAVQLFATGGGVLSSVSFALIRDVTQIFRSDSLETCIAQSFTAYIAQSRVPEVVNSSHLNFLKQSIIELCSLDVQITATKAFASVDQLSQILLWALQTKNKEAFKKICSWEYVNCVDLWVAFISANLHDYDLQTLLFRTIQLINGIALLFAGPRYFPLKLKCISWLNNISASSGIFIPVTSSILDILEYKIDKVSGKAGKALKFSSLLKLPKTCLKSHGFQEECLLSVIEQLSIHFSQWSHHISFPELATIPLIRLRKFYDTLSTESSRRMVKRFIDQVEQNVDFVQKKRSEIAFSPNDHQSVESFLQVEKSNKSAPFNQYYRSMVERAAQRR